MGKQKQKIPFTKRTRRPAEGNLFYQCNQQREKGGKIGYNPCIRGNPEKPFKIHYPNCALQNCTGYVHGRKMEAESWSSHGIVVKSTRLSTGHAGTYWDYTQDGYERGQEPKVGAIACWKGGKNNYGHVAYVEEVKKDGTVIVSESHWESISYWNTWTGNPKKRWKTIKFQGYIYTDVEWC